MSNKGLEALEEIKEFAKNEWEDERFDFAIIETALKVFEIIIEKRVTVDRLLKSDTVFQYNYAII